MYCWVLFVLKLYETLRHISSDRHVGFCRNSSNINKSIRTYTISSSWIRVQMYNRNNYCDINTFSWNTGTCGYGCSTTQYNTMYSIEACLPYKTLWSGPGNLSSLKFSSQNPKYTELCTATLIHARCVWWTMVTYFCTVTLPNYLLGH